LKFNLIGLDELVLKYQRYICVMKGQALKVTDVAIYLNDHTASTSPSR
jgi:hypothetical protein